MVRAVDCKSSTDLSVLRIDNRPVILGDGRGTELWRSPNALSFIRALTRENRLIR